MPSKYDLHGPTGYQKRKQVTDPRTATLVFPMDFAQAAFTMGSHIEPRGEVFAQDPMMVNRIGDFGHAGLATCCLAYFLLTQGAHERPEHTAYLRCVRTIRDAAREIAAAADELAEQNRLHRQKAGFDDTSRIEALVRMSVALHSEWLPFVGETIFGERVIPRSVGNPFSDNRTIHGLSAVAGLAHAAENMISQHRQQGKRGTPEAGTAMRSGNQANIERDAFVLDLADVYRSVVGKPTASPSTDRKKSPFMRFVLAVFKGLREQTIEKVDSNLYLPPSEGTVRALLQRLPS